MVPELVRYLEDLSLHLRLNPLRERQVIREMYTHLEDRVRDLEEAGRSRDLAVAEATSKFGTPVAVAQELSHVHSDRSWGNALLAAAPYAGIFLLFALHAWQSLPWVCVFLSVSVVMTLIGWWRGKPQWMYPWAGFALLIPMVTGIIAIGAVWKDGNAYLNGDLAKVPGWALLGLLIYIPFSLWMLISVMIKVIRFDWLMASLMLLPFPILTRWMLSLQFEGSALAYNRTAFNPEADLVVALVFLVLAALPVLFVRIQQRPVKIGALTLVTPPSFIVAAYNTPGKSEFWALALFALLALVVLMLPALLDRRVGRGSSGYKSNQARWAEQILSDA